MDALAVSLVLLLVGLAISEWHDWPKPVGPGWGVAAGRHRVGGRRDRHPRSGPARRRRLGRRPHRPRPWLPPRGSGLFAGDSRVRHLDR